MGPVVRRGGGWEGCGRGGKTGVTGPGLRHLAGLRELTTLSLRGTLVDDDSLAHLAGLRSLVTLNLSDT